MLQDNDTFAIKATFYGEKKESMIMCLPKSMHALQNQEECMKVFTLTWLDQFFQMLPCEVDAKRCHELLMTLQEDGTCMLSDLEGEPIELNLTPNIVTRALKIQEGNHNISSMKLNPGDRLIAFTQLTMQMIVFMQPYGWMKFGWHYKSISNIFTFTSHKSIHI